MKRFRPVSRNILILIDKPKRYIVFTLHSFSVNLKTCVSILVDFDYFEERKRNQIDSIAESTDKAAKANSRALHMLDDVARYVRFKKENPLRKYVPAKELFNGLSYFDYEREYLLYYNMIENRSRPGV